MNEREKERESMNGARRKSGVAYEYVRGSEMNDTLYIGVTQ